MLVQVETWAYTQSTSWVLAAPYMEMTRIRWALIMPPKTVPLPDGTSWTQPEGGPIIMFVVRAHAADNGSQPSVLFYPSGPRHNARSFAVAMPGRRAPSRSESYSA